MGKLQMKMYILICIHALNYPRKNKDYNNKVGNVKNAKIKQSDIKNSLYIQLEIF